MKYNIAKIVDESGTRIINIENITENEAKKFLDKIFCPGDGCMAPLYLVHNPNDGGRTIFFKATNDEHNPECIYKNENGGGGRGNGSASKDGYYTEAQINDYVRNLYKDVTTPDEEKKKKTANGPRRRKDASGEDGEKERIKGGRIISGGEQVSEGNKGRMSRRYEVSEADVGSQIGVYGDVDSLVLDQYGQLHITFKDVRYSNIEILVGQVYNNLNPVEYEKLDSVKQYYDEMKKNNQRVYMAAGGLVTKYNERLTIELQAQYSFRFNGLSILDIIRGKY